MLRNLGKFTNIPQYMQYIFCGILTFDYRFRSL